MSRRNRIRLGLVGVLLASSIVGSGATSAAQAGLAQVPDCIVGARQSPRADRSRYRIMMTVDPATATVSGHTDVEINLDLPTDRIVVRLWPNGGVRDTAAPLATLTNSMVAGTAVKSTRPDPTTVVITVAGANGLKPGEPTTLSFDWTVQARGERSDRVSVSRATDGTLIAARFGSFLPVVAWEPGVGWNTTPPTNGGAEASMNPAADYDVTISTSGLNVIASGDRSIDAVAKTERYQSVGQRDWAMSLGTFRFARRAVVLNDGTSVAVTVGVSASLPASELASGYLARVGAALLDESRRFGTYPWSTYTLAITPGLKGGIEYPSHVMQGPSSIGRTTPHEVGHQWFYALVGNDQGRDPWLDEGLATWAEARAEGSTKTFLTKDIPADGRNRLGAPMTYWDKHRSSYYRSVYVQTVHALNALGDPARTDCVLARYVARYAYGIATPRNLIETLDENIPGAQTTFSDYGVTFAK
jgi:Peptidase family M1 domain